MSEAIMQSLDKIESALEKFATKQDVESRMGTVSTDTKTAIDNLGIKQRELADEIVQLKQRGASLPEDNKPGMTSWGKQFVGSEEYKGKLNLMAQGMKVGNIGFEVKNTLTGSDTNVAPDRKPGIVRGAIAPLTLQDFLPKLPTSSNAIEFTKENAFTNAAAEAAEGAAKAESSLTWTLVNMPVSTVAHWIKISRQLAADNTALAAYVDTRMRYGVNRKVETQLASGDGTAPNISGIFDSGNYVAHGIANAALGSVLKKLVLIRTIMGTLEAQGDMPDAILMNPADWAQIEIDLFTVAAGQVRVGVNEMGQRTLFGVPVISTVGVTADTFAVGNFAQACTMYEREGVIVEMSDSDSDNFTKNLITIRAERRLALATERPAAIIGGDLTPA
jgi:HK97 family phage major capsid protein